MRLSRRSTIAGLLTVAAGCAGVDTDDESAPAVDLQYIHIVNHTQEERGGR